MDKEQISEAENTLKEYKKAAVMPQAYKKQRAYWGKQCRKNMRECTKILNEKLIPFFELVREKHRHESAVILEQVQKSKKGRRKKTFHVAVKKESTIVSSNNLKLGDVACELLHQNHVTEKAAV